MPQLRPSRPIRLVALDLDGTTLNPEHQLSPATKAVLRELTELGVVVVLASGRLPASILPFAREMGLEGEHIGLNGGVAFDLEGVFRHKHTLTVEQVQFGIECLRSRGLDAMVFTTDTILAPQMSEGRVLLRTLGEPEVLHYHSDQLFSILDPIKLVTVLAASDADAELSRLVSSRLLCVRTGPQFLEFMAPGVSKGAALTEILADLGIAADESLSIGDSENDESLFEATGFSVAMGNASAELKAKADWLTATNAQDGVAVALRKFVLEELT